MELIIFLIFSIWYWIGEGATEGYTWASEKRRVENVLISPGVHDDPFWYTANGFMCYHSWRVLGENIGILGMIISAIYFSCPLLVVIGWIAGSTLISIFFYERILNYVSYGKLFPQKTDWDLFKGKIRIPRRPWQDWLMLSIGIIILILI